MFKKRGIFLEFYPCLYFCVISGKPRGAVVTFACHQDCTPGVRYSGAFSHVLSNEMKKEFGENFITVFLAGTSGDINHVGPRLHGYMPDDIYIKMENVLVVLYCKTLLHMLKYMQEGFYD